MSILVNATEHVEIAKRAARGVSKIAPGCGTGCVHLSNLRKVGKMVREAQAGGRSMQLHNAQRVHHFARSQAQQAGHTESEIKSALSG